MGDFLSVGEASEALNISEQRIRTLIRQGRIVAQRIGRSWIVPVNEIENFDMKDLRVNSMATQDRITKKSVSKTKMNVLSFFSGAMGLDIGLTQAGMNILLACEIDKASRKTIEVNEKKVGLIGDIRDYTTKQILEYAGAKAKDIDLICGGPPCQAFSTAGKRMGFQDDRGNVFLKYIDVIKEIQPQYAILENVRGLLSSKMNIIVEKKFYKKYGDNIGDIPGSALFYIVDRLEEAGYEVSFNLYNAANFGVPQKRERVIIIASRNGKVPYLTPTNSENSEYNLPKWKTFKECIEDINETNEFVKFSENRLKYFRMLKEGQYWKNLPKKIQEEALGNSFHLGGGKTGFFRRLAWNKPSPTLVTHPAMPATELAHPVKDRPLSISEYKRIQEFPDDWNIQGSLVDKYKQIGNAVPIGLGRAIGKHIYSHSNGRLKRNNFSDFRFSRYVNTSHEDWTALFQKEMRKVKMADQLEIF